MSSWLFPAGNAKFEEVEIAQWLVNVKIINRKPYAHYK